MNISHFSPVGLISSPRYSFLGGLCAAVLLVLRCLELRCCCTLSLQVEVTDETIQQMVRAGTWKLPKHEDTQEVLERQPQLDMIVDYIQHVQKGEKAGKGVFPLLGTAGMIGVGKTQLLLNGLKRASELENVTGPGFTFNGQGNLKELFQQSLGTEKQYGDALGQALLRACEVSA